MAQSASDVNRLLVFAPDENSAKFNKIYTENFFFGNFGIKPLVNALPIQNENLRIVRISALSDGKRIPDIMILNYDKAGKLTKMKVSEELSGKAMTVDYVYQEGLISQEIFSDAEGKRTNKFYYSEGKMIVKNFRDMIDVFQLKGKILFKETFLDGKKVFKDRIEGKCRITQYLQEDIDKTCYSNFQGELPFSMEEFTTTENTKTKKITLVPETKWTIEKQRNGTYSILSGKSEIYRVELDKNTTVKNFEFMGNKSENKKPVKFSFSYIYY
jgi:hypothetical protein